MGVLNDDTRINIHSESDDKARGVERSKGVQGRMRRERLKPYRIPPKERSYSVSQP